jgi:hypothetical protein
MIIILKFTTLCFGASSLFILILNASDDDIAHFLLLDFLTLFSELLTVDKLQERNNKILCVRSLP